MPEYSLGLSMIVKNEARNLPLSLAPVKDLFDEVVVVDTGSGDGSVELARGYGATVLSRPWRADFAAARNEGLAAMSTDFIMWLDADNGLPPEGVPRFRRLLSRHGPEVILWATEVTVPQGDRIRQKRVFPRGPYSFFEGRVHEQLRHPSGCQQVLTEVEITHWGYENGARARQKGLRNLAILLEMPQTRAGDFYWLYQTGRTLFNLRRFEEAEGWLQRAAEAEHNNFPLWGHTLILLAQAQSRLGRWERAEAGLRRLVQVRPGYGPGHYHLGRLLYNLNRPLEAAAHLEASIILDPGDLIWGGESRPARFRAAFILGRLWAETRGREQSARQAFDFARQMEPRNPEPELALAELALKRGQTSAARRHLERGLALAPGSLRALKALQDLESRFA